MPSELLAVVDSPGQLAGYIGAGASVGGMAAFVLAELWWLGWNQDVPGEKWVYYGVGLGSVAGFVAAVLWA